MDEEQPQVVTLCGVHGCCPTLESGADGVVLRDDFGGTVRLTKPQWADLMVRVQAGELV